MVSRIGHLVVLGLVALSVACSGKTEDEPKVTAGDAPAEAAASQAAARPSAAPLEKRLADIGALTDLIVAEANDLPRAEFDPDALLAVIGKDPETLFEWVRDRTHWAPYRGLLRGAKGVMLDRLGSSLDRAVLLGDLLRRSGHTVRLVHAELPEAKARELLAKVRPIPAQRRAPAAPREMPTERRRTIAALMPDFEREAEKQIAESKRITAEAEALVRSQSETLLAAVREAANPEGSSEEDAAIAAMRNHWWVEREEGDKWVAMDPSLPDAKEGESLAAASARSEWPPKAEAPSIPESEWHTVQVRVIVERYEAGKTRESIALEALLRPAEVLDRPVTLSHLPLPWPTELPNPDVSPQPFREAALAVKEWVPLLRIGRDQIIQSGFTIAGELDTKLEETLSDISKGDLSKVSGIQVAGGMDMALGGFSADEAVPAATAEWIDYEIRVPGAPVERLRHQIFDLLGPARRASGAADFDGSADLRKLERFEALWGPTDILLQPSEFSGEFVAHLASAGIVANERALKVLAQERDAAKVRSLAKEMFGRADLWGPLPNLVLWRTALAPASAAFIDRPNVLIYRGSRSMVNTDRVIARALIDIVSNGTGVRPGADIRAFEIRLRQGVADTVAEILAVSSELQMAENTASIFSRLAGEGSRGQLVAARDQAAVKVLPWPEDEAMRVGADIDAGFMAVVPRMAVLIDGQQRVGWWRVHPTTGETIGVMDTGFHAMEYPKLVALVTAAGAVLSNPDFVARAQRLQQLASNGARLNPAQWDFLRQFWACQALDRAIAKLGGG